MRLAIVAEPDGGARVLPLDEDGRPAGDLRRVPDLVEAVRDGGDARWVWADTTEFYPRVLAAGVRVERCHDVALTEALVSGYEGRWGEPCALPAAWARLAGREVPPDPPPRTRDDLPTLFTPAPDPLPGGADPLDALVAVHAAQLRRIAATEHPARFRLLVAAESAGALIAAEMGHDGIPWRADVHDRVLTDLLGGRPAAGGPPPRLVALAEKIAAAFGGRRLHPDSPAEVLRAFAREGITLPSTRSWVLKRVTHPAVAPLLEYKELARLHSAHGWSWLSTWVRDGRFRPEYVPAGVVSGRWATRGGGALQIPRVVRQAVIADPGWRLVVADASQLEPRILAAMAGDARLAEAAAGGDLYEALAAQAFGGDRARAKIAMLGTLYGQTSGEAATVLPALRQRFPTAVDYVERAARAGEEGRLVRSWLGRTCPPGTPPDPAEGGEGFARSQSRDGLARSQSRDAFARSRSRGRFTRNFVVQATAAEWALTVLATLRRRLVPGAARLVFFQHDEVLVHCPEPLAAEVAAAVDASAAEATRLLFGPTPVRLPFGVSVVACYADAK